MSVQTQAARPTLHAQHSDPWIGVHALTEFSFCPRAGLICHETELDEGDDDDVNRRKTHRQYLPYYDKRSVYSSYQKFIEKMKIWSVILAVSVIAILSSYMIYGFWHMTTFGLTIIGIMILVKWKNIAISTGTISKRKYQFENANPAIIPNSLTENFPVNWCELVAAGYEAYRPEDAYRDHDWKLAGKPWRVLRFGESRIPVFRLKTLDREENKDIPALKKIRRQHAVRIGAYCRVLERAEGAISPFGVVVVDGSYDAVLIPNSPYTRKPFHTMLKLARETVTRAKNGNLPSAPDEHKCYRCPIGRPFVDRTDTRHTSKPNIQPFNVLGVDDRYYHSSCGDRFRWTPPHEKAFAKQLYEDADEI